MATNDYHFVTHWRMRATAEEVADILSDVASLPRWWPSVYLGVEEVEAGAADGVGKIIDLHTRGWLPYTLRWRFRVTESDYPHRLGLEAWGDFIGRGEWTLTEDGEWVDVVYDWRVRAEKPLLRILSPIMKPIFAANHHWAMRQGEMSLERELERRKHQQ